MLTPLTPPVEALIFDLDGTLLDTVKDLAVGVNRGRAHFNLPPIPELIIGGYVGDGIDLLLERSFQDTGITVAQAKPIVGAYYETHMLDNTAPYPGVAETLARLPQVKAVITNKPEKFVPKLLAQFNLDQYFTVLVGGNTLPFLKPAPETGFYAAQKLGVKPEAVVVVGDHRTDLDLAINCGMRSVFCNYGIGRSEGRPSTWQISAFSELAAIFA